jgi:succinoglycan biosynthesis transport protein ExoP
MTLAQYWRVLAKHRLLAVIPFLVLVGAALIWSKQVTPEYTARSSVWFTGQSATDPYQGANYTQSQMGSYAQLATKPIVLEPVIESLGLNTTPHDLAGTITALVVPSSVIVDITATDSDPQRSASIANAVTDEVAKVAKNLAPSLPNGQAAVSATVVAAATPPRAASEPDTRRNVVAGALLGFLLGLLLPVFRDALESKVHDPEDIPAGLPVLATVPWVKPLPWSGRGGRRSQHAELVLTESLRKVRASLRFLEVERPVKLIAFSSSVAFEGKTSLSIQLARVLAEGSGDVLLLDGDLRHPQVATYLTLDGGIGLADVLAGSVTLDQAVQQTSTGLHVLPAGSAVQDPAELFASGPMSALMNTLRERYDYVVIDSPPLLPVADASVLATHADALVLIARYGKVTRAQVSSSIEQLNRVDAHVAGAVLNAVPRPRRWRSRSSYDPGRRGVENLVGE